MFSMFLSSRAVPATPGERLGASTEHLPETCSLRAILRRSASPPWLTRLRLSSLRATARGFAAGGLPTSRHAGPASAGHLATSRRGPRFPTAQRFIGVGSFHPTRNTPLHGAPKHALPGRVADLTVALFAPPVLALTARFADFALRLPSVLRCRLGSRGRFERRQPDGRRRRRNHSRSD